MRTSSFIILFIASLALLFCPACSSEQQVDPLLFRADSLVLHTEENGRSLQDGKGFLSNVFQDIMGQRNVVAIYSMEGSSVYLFRLDNGQLLHIYTIKDLPTEDIYDFYLAADQTLYFSTAGELIQCDSTKVTRHFYAKRAIEDRYYSYAYHSSADFVMDSNKRFYQNMLPKGLDANAPDWMERNFSMPFMGRFQIVGDSLVCIDSTLYFPEYFKQTYYYEHFPKCIFRGNRVDYIFGYADSMYSLNLQTRQQTATAIHKLDPDYQPISVDRDSVYDMNYMYKCAVMTPSIRIFLYDPYRKIYYLGIKKAQPYLADDGVHVNNVFDFPFRIYLLDTNFRKLRSVDFPKGRFAALYQSFVGPKGLYLMLAHKKNITYEVYDFSRAAH